MIGRGCKLDSEEYERIAEQGMTEEFADVEKLYEATYRLDMRLEGNKEKLTEEIYNLIKEDIIDTYWIERNRIHNRYDIDHKREEFEHSERSEALVPRAWRFLFLHHENVAAKLIMEDVNIDMDAFFAESEVANDERRPEYMPKMYLSRAQKREGRRAARRERKAEREKRARLRKLEQDRKQQKKKDRMKAKRDAELEARRKRREARQAKRKARQELRRQRAAENAEKRKALRQKRRDRRKQTTSPKSPKTGTKQARSPRTFSTQIPRAGDVSPNVCMEKSPSKGKGEQK